MREIKCSWEQKRASCRHKQAQTGTNKHKHMRIMQIRWAPKSTLEAFQCNFSARQRKSEGKAARHDEQANQMAQNEWETREGAGLSWSRDMATNCRAAEGRCGGGKQRIRTFTWRCLQLASRESEKPANEMKRNVCINDLIEFQCKFS